jgi:predicted ArsR family transcriptional regulator
MGDNRFPVDLLGKWLKVLMESLNESLDEKTRKEIMEKCGKACAIYHGDIDEIKLIKRKGENLEKILETMNQEELWCGKWFKKGNTISSICEKCGCPFVGAEIIKPSPTFCYCSRGWVKSVFELVLEKPVEVELKKAIGKGDGVCQFIIQGIE